MSLRYSKIICLILFFSFSISPKLKAQRIETIIGSGFNGNIGNDGLAICAGTPYPQSIAYDGKNHIYITSTNSVRKVNLTTGIITRVSGSDTWGYSGDGGQALNALMQFPKSLVIDTLKQILYIAEYSGHRIREINLNTGIIRTIAGNSSQGFSGDGGPAVSASLNTPISLCLDYKGNLFVADYYNSRVRKINLTTGIINTILGDGLKLHSGDGGPSILARTPYPISICSDKYGNIYVVENVNLISNRIRKIDYNTGIITTIAGNDERKHSGDGGLATNATLLEPVSVYVDSDDDIYIVEYVDPRVRKIDHQTNHIQTIAGVGLLGFFGDGGLAKNAGFHNPLQIIGDNQNNLYIADNFNHRVRKISSDTSYAPIPFNSVTISGSTTTICYGTEVIFNATTNPLLVYSYQWKINNNAVGDNNSTFKTTNLKDGDIVSCSISAMLCNNQISSNSNTIKITVQPSFTPTINISTTNTEICQGANVVFNSFIYNAGTTPKYEWFINGHTTGSVTPSYNSSNLQNNDSVQCKLTIDPSLTCATQESVLSNIVKIKIISVASPEVKLVASKNELCLGESVTFSANVKNEVPGSIIEWWENNNRLNDTGISLIRTSLDKPLEVYFKLVPPPNNCFNQIIQSNTEKISIKPIPIIYLSPVDTTILVNTEVFINATVSNPLEIKKFQWSPESLLHDINTLTPTTKKLSSTTVITFKVTTNNNCEISRVSKINVYSDIYIPNAFSPNNDNLNDYFGIIGSPRIQLIDFSIFNRFGNLVFKSAKIEQKWNGTNNGIFVDPGVYIYEVKFRDGSKNIHLKGTVLLIR